MVKWVRFQIFLKSWHNKVFSSAQNEAFCFVCFLSCVEHTYISHQASNGSFSLCNKRTAMASKLLHCHSFQWFHPQAVRFMSYSLIKNALASFSNAGILRSRSSGKGMGPLFVSYKLSEQRGRNWSYHLLCRYWSPWTRRPSQTSLVSRLLSRHHFHCLIAPN